MVPSSRRQQILERWRGAPPRWLSLDAFDTLLWRPFAHPTHVFFEVHRALAAGRRPLPVTADVFVRLRIEAEAAARRRHSSGEVTLEEIADELSRALGGTAWEAALAAAEIEIERASIRLDRDAAAIVSHAASNGVPYVLVSDMYLRGEQILDLLAAAISRSGSAIRLPEHVFVSGERRTNKNDRLFALVVDRLGCAPGDILHIGDHPRSDVEAAERCGIRSFHYVRETPFAATVHELEARYLDPGMHTGSDHGLRTLRSKAMASAGAETGGPSHFEYGMFVLGPILTLFAQWVVDDCTRTGADRIFCLMREGHLLAPLIEKAARAAGVALEARRLWISRYATRAASFTRGSREELAAYFVRRRVGSLDAIAHDLGLDLAAARDATNIRHADPLSADETERVIDAVTGVSALRSALTGVSAEKRRRLVKYLEQTGLFERDRETLVDLGWGGTIQRSLPRLFHEGAGPRELRGLYLVTNERIRELPEGSSADGFLVHAQPYAGWAAHVQRTPQLLEQACMAPQGSFSGVDAGGAIATFPQMLAPDQRRQVDEVQRGIHHFADLWLAEGLASPAERATLVPRLRAILVRALDAPTREEVRLFAAWEHDDNEGGASSERLIGSAELRARARWMTYPEIQALSWLDCFWPQGLARLAGKSQDEPERLWMRSKTVRAGLSFCWRFLGGD